MAGVGVLLPALSGANGPVGQGFPIRIDPEQTQIRRHPIVYGNLSFRSGGGRWMRHPPDGQTIFVPATIRRLGERVRIQIQFPTGARSAYHNRFAVASELEVINGKVPRTDRPPGHFGQRLGHPRMIERGCPFSFGGIDQDEFMLVPPGLDAIPKPVRLAIHAGEPVRIHAIVGYEAGCVQASGAKNGGHQHENGEHRE